MILTPIAPSDPEPASDTPDKVDAIGNENLTVVVVDATVASMFIMPLTVTTVPTRIYWAACGVDASTFELVDTLGVYVPDVINVVGMARVIDPDPLVTDIVDPPVIVAFV